MLGLRLCAWYTNTSLFFTSRARCVVTTFVSVRGNLHIWTSGDDVFVFLQARGFTYILPLECAVLRRVPLVGFRFCDQRDVALEERKNAICLMDGWTIRSTLRANDHSASHRLPAGEFKDELPSMNHLGSGSRDWGVVDTNNSRDVNDFCQNFAQFPLATPGFDI